MLVTSLTCLSTSIMLFGFSWNTATFLICWSLAKFFSSSSGIVLTKIVSNWFPKKNYGVAFGFLSTSIEFGPTIALMVFGLIQKSFSFNWRFIFWASGGLIVVVQLFSVAPLKTKPKYVGLNDEDSKIDKEIHPMDDKTLFDALVYMFLSPRFYLILVAQALFNPVYNLPQNWIPLYFVDVLRFSKGDSASITSILTFTKCVGVFAGGLIFDLLCKNF
jgi:sugar phosphate permease